MPLKIKCPTCRKEIPWEGNPHRPFCSDRCRLIDLGAWSQERYRIAGEEFGATTMMTTKRKSSTRSA